MIEPKFTSEELANFRRDGYLVSSLFEADDVREMMALYESASSGCGTGFYTSLWSKDVEYRRRVHEGASKILGRKRFPFLEEYRMCLANFAVKQPGSGEGKVPLHQDWSMTDESQYAPVTLWCPLTDVNEVNGCLMIVPGSHRSYRRVRPNFDLQAGYSPLDPIAAELETNHVRKLPMRAGECFIYDPCVIHGSEMNRSPECRIALVAAFIPQQAPLLHYFQTSKERTEVYEVHDDFYWRDVVLGEPPLGHRLVDVLEREPVTFTLERAPSFSDATS